MSETARFVAASCFHAPFTDPDAWNWMLDQVRSLRRKPTHFIMLGDWFEAGSASVHPNEYDHEQYEEYEFAAEQSREIRKVVGNRCQLIWTHGNHDDNLQAKDPRRVPRNLRGLVHWSKYAPVAPEFARWQQVPYTKDRRGVYEIGPVMFWHGFDTGPTSDELETLQVANLMGSHAHRLGVRGHTHSPVAPRAAQRTRRIALPWEYCNVGTLGPVRPDWARRQDTSTWGAGLLVGTANTEPAPYSSKQYDVELLTR